MKKVVHARQFSRRQADLIIFDCDGVVVDSELIACEIEAAALSRLGFELTPEEIASQFVGIPAREWHQTLTRESSNLMSDAFEAEIETLIIEAFSSRLQPMPGVEQALRSIEIPFCIASSSSPARIRRALSIVELRGLFEPHIYSASMVARGKPAPDLFLFAAARMGVHPSRCIVVEDSVSGVKAAVAAGMRVLGFSGGSHCYAEHAGQLLAQGAVFAFTQMALLPEFLGRACSRSGLRKSYSN